MFMIKFLDQLQKASSSSILFECGLRSLKLLLLGQQRLYIIWVRASVPQIASFRPAAPLHYSSAGFGPSNCFFWACSASILLECGLWSLELLPSGQQCFFIIRVWILVPWIISFGPAVPLYYSSAGFGSSNCFLRSSNASILFECEIRSLEFASFGPAAPLYQSNKGFALWISISLSMFSPLPETRWQ
jgi:hypothetical protein